ncbi:MAG TPA: uroporphyrinogen-III synthase [Pseudomonadales bacterium]|nr:uroporphyrinogen-III synthase [Pseudomonadales bacterium]
MTATVLLTRAKGRNEALAARLGAEGVSVIIMPMLAVESTNLPETARQQAINLDRYDHIIFVSASAVEFGLPVLEEYWPQWPAMLRWHAVGAATAARLASFDILATAPEEASSEGLIASGVLDGVDGAHVLVVRGKGGRELLARELAGRGAEVDYLEVYQRRPIVLGAEARRRLAGHRPLVAVAYSGDTVEALAANLDEIREGLAIVVPSDRVKNVAMSMGFSDVMVAGGADEDAICGATLSVSARVANQ